MEFLPAPSNQDKERIVRANLNRLNNMSYWFCLDRAGPDAKVNVFNAIHGNATFPAAYRSVSEAIQGAERVGRPGNRCLISLILLYKGATPQSVTSQLGASKESRSWSHKWMSVEFFEDDWAKSILGEGRAADLLASEWSLRVVSLGDPFVADLLGGGRQSGELLKKLAVTHGVGVNLNRYSVYKGEVNLIVDSISDDPSLVNLDFWSAGQHRSNQYEPKLVSHFANYNKTSSGFLTYRPDLVVEPYVVCSVLSAAAAKSDAISSAIQRKAHVFEFTTSQANHPSTVVSYLRTKLQNYVTITESQ